MASDGWTKETLGNLGKFRNGVNFSKKDYGPGFPIVNVKQLYSGRYADITDLLEVRPSAISNLESVRLQHGDVLFARSSVKASGAGQAVMIGPCPPNAVFSGFIIRFRVTAQDRVVPEFLNYFFRSPSSRELLTRIGSGTTITNLSQATLAALEVPLPSVPEQRAIACILGALDDKIELNQRMNETLEAMARTIFKSWFVDFDPVRAKAEGQQPPGLALHIADLFPNAFEDSELGEIPKWWEVTDVATVGKVASGKRPPVRFSEPTDDARVPLWGGNGPMAFVSEPLYRSPILLTGRVGTLGSVFRISTLCWPSDNTLVVMARNDAAYEFLYFQLQKVDYLSLNRGSTQPLLTQTDLKSQKFVIPSKNLMEHFHKIVGTLFERIDASQNESRTLAALRDTLLPRLISGELRLLDAERIVGRAVI